jgi:hypothetical protein
MLYFPLPTKQLEASVLNPNHDIRPSLPSPETVWAEEGTFAEAELDSPRIVPIHLLSQRPQSW